MESKHLDINRTAWNQLTADHLGSDFYDVEGFKKQDEELNVVEQVELPDLKGKSVLHLQCHFGMDSLSMERKGAVVTGVDLSPDAIVAAENLRDEMGLKTRFVCSDIYEFGKKNEELFDIVYTSYGVINWLPDMNAWAQLIADALKPGGTLFFAEFHPSVWLLDGAPYFPQKEPVIETWDGYTDVKSRITSCEWPHSLSEIVTALLKAGLRIESFKEYPFHFSNWMERDEQRDDGLWKRMFKGNEEPVLFSITATKQ